MDVQLNDFKRQWAETHRDVLGAVERVGASGWYVLGPEVARFEGALGAAWGLEHAVGCASGLDAIELALRACEVAPGAKVVTTPLSAFATTLAIVRAGCVPVFVDVDAAGHLDLEAATAALEADPAIRALVPVHLYGQALDLDALRALRDRFEVTVIEDCAQSIGASWHGARAGTVGRAAATSFYPTKNLGALGDGGAIATGDADVAARARSLRDYGQASKYVHDVLGLNSRLDELHAAVLADANLPRLGGWTTRRRTIAARYREALATSAVRPLPFASPSEGVWHLFPVAVQGDRDAFRRHLAARGIQSGVHYPRLIPDQHALAATVFEVRGCLDRARALAAAEVSLPIHPYLGDEEIDHVLRAVEAWRPA